MYILALIIAATVAIGCVIVLGSGNEINSEMGTGVDFKQDEVRLSPQVGRQDKKRKKEDPKAESSP